MVGVGCIVLKRLKDPVYSFTTQAIKNFADQRAKLARRADRREEWRAQMERERLDLERERFAHELEGEPKTPRAIRDDIETQNTKSYPLLKDLQRLRKRLVCGCENFVIALA